MHKVTSVESNIKWIDTTFEYFHSCMGICQGDHIFPYLFVLCLDKLSHLITCSVDIGDWKTIKTGKQGHAMSHLMFADDLLLFGEVTTRQMKCMTRILNKFCNMSGEQVSQEKNIIFLSKNVSRCKREQLVQLSGFNETSSIGK